MDTHTAVMWTNCFVLFRAHGWNHYCNLEGGLNEWTLLSVNGLYKISYNKINAYTETS